MVFPDEGVCQSSAPGGIMEKRCVYITALSWQLHREGERERDGERRVRNKFGSVVTEG